MRKSIIVSRRLALFFVCAFMSVAQAMADDVATIGSTGYATLEEALNAATSGSTVVLTSDYTLNSAVTVKSGVNLVIPYKEGGGLITTPDVVTTFQNPTNSSYGAYATLTLSSTASITVEDGGVLCVAGQQYGTSNAMSTSTGGPGSVSGKYGCVDMSKGGKITLNSGAILYAWGYIVGQNKDEGNNTSGCGTIEALAGSTVYEDFVIGDYHGGRVTATMVKGIGYTTYKVFPFNQYFVPNIEVPLTLHYGAKDITHYFFVAMGSTEVKDAFTFIGYGSADDKGLFNMDSGESTTIKKWYDPQKDQQCYETTGNVSIQQISMTMSVFGISANINSSEFVLPITSTMRLVMNHGTIDAGNDLEVLPGAEVVIGEDAVVNVGKNLFIFDADEWTTKEGTDVNFAYDKYYMTYLFRPSYDKSSPYNNWKNKNVNDAKLEVNGTLNINGNLYTTAGGADICGTGEQGKIVFSNATGASNVYQVNGVSGSSSDGNHISKYMFITTDVYCTQIPVTAAKLKNKDAETDAECSYTTTAGITASESNPATFHNEDGKWYNEKETVALKQEQDVTSIQNDWTAADTEYKKYTLTRTFYKGWNSVVLPFATTRAKLGADEAIEFTGAPVNDGENTVTLQFKGVESLEANKPYMLYYASDPGEKTYSFVEKRTAPQTETDNKVTVTQDQFQFIGSYVYYDKGNTFIQSGDYLVSEDGFSKTTVGGNRLYAYRAFFHPTEATSAKLNFTVDGDEVTGIRAIQLEDALRGENTVGNGRLYNLSGQRVNSSYKGIVVKNGKKMLLK